MSSFPTSWTKSTITITSWSPLVPPSVFPYLANIPFRRCSSSFLSAFPSACLCQCKSWVLLKLAESCLSSPTFASAAARSVPLSLDCLMHYPNSYILPTQTNRQKNPSQRKTRDVNTLSEQRKTCSGQAKHCQKRKSTLEVHFSPFFPHTFQPFEVSRLYSPVVIDGKEPGGLYLAVS